MSATPPGWHPDPQGRHQHRFWDGTTWTDQVSDDGVVSTDALNPTPPPSATSDPGPAGGDPGSAGSGPAGEQPAADATVFGAAGSFGTPPPGGSGPTPGPSQPSPTPLLPTGGATPPPGAPQTSAASGFGGGAATPPPGASGPPPGSPNLPGSNTPPPPRSSSKLPFVIVGAVVLVAVLIVGFLLLRGGGNGGTADGDYKLTVKQGQVTVRKVELKAGEAIFVRAKGKNLRRALAIDAADYDKYVNRKFVNTDDSSFGRAFDARSFFSDDSNLRRQLSGFDTGSPKFRYPGFSTDVVFVRSFVGGSRVQPWRADDYTFVAPIGGTYYIALRSTGGDEQVALSIRTKPNPDVKSDLDTNGFSDLSSDFYTDFRSDATDQVNSSGS